MRHRHDRDVHARERADLLCVHAAGVDDDLGLDPAPIGLDARHASALDGHARDPGAGRDLRSAAPRTFGERERQLARVDVAVGRQERRAEDAVRGHRREELLRLVGRDQLERQTERLRPARLPRDLLHPLGRRREPERSDLVPARLETHFGLERAVEVDALHHHPRERERAAELTNQARRVEGRPARELGALDEHHVLPAESCEPVEDGAAADSASDHDCAGLISHGWTLTGRREVACNPPREHIDSAAPSTSMLRARRASRPPAGRSRLARPALVEPPGWIG